MKNRQKSLWISAASALLLAGCAKTAGTAPEDAPLAPEGWADVTADFISPDGDTVGKVLFKQAPNGGVLIRLSLTGLTPGWHGIHLHEVGDCSDGADGFKASGGHVDPEDRAHGLLHPDGPEAADMPNIHAGAEGTARAELFNAWVSLEGDAGLLDDSGFAVVVHENADDHMTQPIGGAGTRVACAAINDET